MKKDCKVAPKDVKSILGVNCEWDQVEVDVNVLSNVAVDDVQKAVDNSPEINKLKQQDTNLKMQLEILKDLINRIAPNDGTPDTKGIKQRLDENESGDKKTRDDIKQINRVISEIMSNITALKSWNSRQDSKMESIKRSVITDTTYYNFDEWIENVYIPQCGALANKYTNGSIYINVNNNNGATNATYINTRSPNSTEPCSAKDWEMLPSVHPYDIITILGIDPIKVTHTNKHEWVISIKPEKLADMLAGLKSLDLSKVNLTLGEVFFEPVFKESATIQENLKVWGEITTPRATIEEANIKKACIEELTCDLKTTKKITADDVEVKWELKANNFKMKDGVLKVDGKVKLEGTVEIPQIQWDIHIQDSLKAPDIHATINITTPDLRVENHSYFKGDIVFEGPVTYTDPDDNAKEPICVDNLYKNLFRPSWGMFEMSGSFIGNNEPNGTVAWIWSNIISFFNQAQRNPVHENVLGNLNATSLTWIKDYWYTPGVYMVNEGTSNQFITINWEGEDAGIYQVNFTLTLRMDDFSESVLNNITSARAGIVVYNVDKIHEGGYILDDKFHPEKDFYEFEHKHTHSFYDDDYPTGSNDTTSESVLKYSSHGRNNLPNGHPNNPPFIKYTARSIHYRTFSVSALVPVKWSVAIAPFVKLASGIPNGTQSHRTTITAGEWDTWSKSSLTVYKIANLGVPYEFHCWRN